MLSWFSAFRVWLPLYAAETPHYIVRCDKESNFVRLQYISSEDETFITLFFFRVPPQAASVLNSKDKAPYILYCEVSSKHRQTPGQAPGQVCQSSVHS